MFLSLKVLLRSGKAPNVGDGGKFRHGDARETRETLMKRPGITCRKRGSQIGPLSAATCDFSPSTRLLAQICGVEIDSGYDYVK